MDAALQLAVKAVPSPTSRAREPEAEVPVNKIQVNEKLRPLAVCASSSKDHPAMYSRTPGRRRVSISSGAKAVDSVTEWRTT